jgi:hypothetical protein
VSTLLRGYLGANDLIQDSLIAEGPFCEAVCNIELQRYKAIRNAFLAVPPATSFLTFISQTHKILTLGPRLNLLTSALDMHQRLRERLLK